MNRIKSRLNKNLVNRHLKIYFNQMWLRFLVISLQNYVQFVMIVLLENIMVFIVVKAARYKILPKITGQIHIFRAFSKGPWEKIWIIHVVMTEIVQLTSDREIDVSFVGIRNVLVLVWRKKQYKMKGMTHTQHDIDMHTCFNRGLTVN